jgi:hypothetical protein
VCVQQTTVGDSILQLPRRRLDEFTKGGKNGGRKKRISEVREEVGEGTGLREKGARGMKAGLQGGTPTTTPDGTERVGNV